MTHIYLVMGTTGEYDDFTEWPVCAYGREEDAQAKVDRCTKRAQALSKKNPNAWLRNIPAEFKDEDPDLEVDYTGTDYHYLAVPFIELGGKKV